MASISHHNPLSLSLLSIFFFLISSHLEFANRIQKQQVRREEREKTELSLSPSLSLSSSNLRREAEVVVVVVVVGAAGEMGP